MSPNSIALVVQFDMLSELPIHRSDIDADGGSESEKLIQDYSLTLVEIKTRRVSRVN